VAAYNAIYADIAANGNVNYGTAYWFSQAGAVNAQQYDPTPAGTFIWNYTIAAARSQGANLGSDQMQVASNQIGFTTFRTLERNNFVFSDVPVAGLDTFDPRSIVATEAGAGMQTLRNMFPQANLSQADWGGTLFAQTRLNDPSYVSDYGLDLTIGSRDCNAIVGGLASGIWNSLSNLSFSSIYQMASAYGALDRSILNACIPQDMTSGDLNINRTSDGGFRFAANGEDITFSGGSTQGGYSVLVEGRSGSVTAAYDGNGTMLSESGANASGATWSENLNGDASTFTYNGQQYSGPTLASGAGLTLGSTIGGILGGNSLAGRIAGAAVLGTLGQSVGGVLSSSGLGTALLGNGSLNPSLLDSAVSTTVANFGGNLGVNAVGDIAGTFSSLLFGEAAQALGLHGFAGGLFTTIGTSITSQLAMNLGSMALNAIGLTNNFVPGSFIGNISGAIGGYFGSYLAAEIVPATGIASSIGGRIGGAIGGFLASEIPVVGTFFGSLVGSVLGTFVGSLFDPHIVPWSSEMVGAVNGVLGINFWNWGSGGNPQEFTSLANMVAGNANQVLALTRRDPSIMNITGLTSLNELVFNQLGSTLTAIYPDGNRTDFYVNGMPQWFALQALYNTGEIATYELVQHAVLVGSDPIVTGALAAARSFPRRKLITNRDGHIRRCTTRSNEPSHTAGWSSPEIETGVCVGEQPTFARRGHAPRRLSSRCFRQHNSRTFAHTRRKAA
jgi:hypothetical protein